MKRSVMAVNSVVLADKLEEQSSGHEKTNEDLTKCSAPVRHSFYLLWRLFSPTLMQILFLLYCAHKQIFEFSTSENSLFVIKCSNKVNYRHFVFSSLLNVPCYIFLNLNQSQHLIFTCQLLNELFLCISEFLMIGNIYHTFLIWIIPHSISPPGLPK